jgi:Tfp pilus assembly protein PilP
MMLSKKILVRILLTFSVGAAAAPVERPVEDFFKNKTRIQNPFELRDPFKTPLIKGKTKVSAKENYTRSVEDDLATMSLQEIKVVGVLIGKERRAVLQVEKGPIVLVKEGMKIGPDQVELKAILPGGIILVEKIVNVYGQEEYLETVVPISK